MSFSNVSNVMGTPKWMPIAQSYVGTKEIPGSKHNPVILEFFDACENGYVKNDETPWCAAFVGAMLHEAGYMGTNSLAARSYLRWGKACEAPSYGCIVVFKRGNSSWQGHVAFFIREDEKHVYVLGGNQRNSVNVSRYPKSKVLGYRVPSKLTNSRTVGGVLSTVVAGGGSQVLEVVEKTQDTLLGIPIPFFQILAAGLALVSLGVIVWARVDDANTKGR